MEAAKFIHAIFSFAHTKKRIGYNYFILFYYFSLLLPLLMQNVLVVKTKTVR